MPFARPRSFHLLRAAGATALCAASFGALLPMATAGATTVAAATGANTAATTAVVRSAHFSPDTAGVDVYLQPFSGGSTQLWVVNEGYGQISQYRRLTPGSYVVSMRPHGAAASTPAAVSWTLDAKAGSAYTAAAVGRNAALQAVVLSDDLSVPAAGTGRVRIVQAASQAPSVTVEANGGTTLAAKLPFGSTSPYTTVPPGQWDVRATPDSGSASPVTGSVAVAAGTSSTVVVSDAAAGGLGIISVVDSASVGIAPTGSVDAGAGGTAPVATPWRVALPVGTAVFALVVGAGAVRRRLRSR